MQLDTERAPAAIWSGSTRRLQDTNRGVVALYAELDERADHLRRADELKSKFLSHMSHEFRTPLNSILALSRLLLARTDGALGNEQEKQVLFIRKAAENLTELVDDLLDLAKVEAGKITISPQTFTAEGLFGTLRGMLRPLLIGDNVALLFGDTTDIPPLETDEGKVSQSLRNFISNALKFTERGEVRVNVVADAVADTVTFSVRDSGIGIAPEDIELIFQEFGQVAHPLQSRVKGTGLGLPLSRKLAELLGGRITVTSTPGQGSTFAVELPRRYRGAEIASESLPDWTADPARIPILLVEDDEADAFAVERWLAGSPFQVLRARSINEAQQAFKSIRPAVILLDVVLLGDESWRLMLHLRQSTTFDDIPLVVLSSTGDERKAMHFGADEYLRKPVDGPPLIALLRRLTGGGDTADILVVDDEPVSRYLVRQLLPKSRYAVREASDGEAGLRQIGLARPALVLLDINMPGLDGYDFLARIAADPALAGPAGHRIDLGDHRPGGARAAGAGVTDRVEIRTRLHRAIRHHRRGARGERGNRAGEAAQRMNPQDARLLVVDDDDAGRYVKLHVLNRYGYTVGEAASGGAALRACETDPPDLVILDTVLPDIGGAEVCRDIKTRWPHVVVLQTSAAHSSTRSRVRALEGGADGFLVEPIEPEELVASVKALLRMHYAEQSVRRLNEDLNELVERRTYELAETRRNLELEITSRQQAEEVIRHAQKLDAIGQLTGGIAHDFNNLLAVILASLGMVRAAFEGRRNYPPAKIKLLIDAAETAAGRGTKVIQQLLAFARRGTLANVVVVIEEVLAGCDAFLRRAVGETVTLRVINADNPWSTRLDPVQLEAALLNLAINARDAMPEGGVLTIETDNVEVPDHATIPPGRYVRLRVTDTGIGMDPEIAKRAFEPFFTTKEVGHGTGLGLSQVYGFVTQSGGHIEVETRPGEGATFIIHLPRCEPAQAILWAEGGETDVPSGHETILVVEDDAGVRDLAVMMIGDFGYRVLAASDGPSALNLLRDGERIDLLFSDVVMPGGMNGFELIRKAREMRGDLKALITSGYVNVRIDEDGPKLPVLAKPYSRTELAHRLRRVLDAA